MYCYVTGSFNDILEIYLVVFKVCNTEQQPITFIDSSLPSQFYQNNKSLKQPHENFPPSC